MAGRIRAHVFVFGTVQGVYYRASTRDAARDRNVDSWVKNRDDGRVEAVFEGEENAVEGMVERCHTGSDAASVDGFTGIDRSYIRSPVLGDHVSRDGIDSRRRNRRSDRVERRRSGATVRWWSCCQRSTTDTMYSICFVAVNEADAALYVAGGRFSVPVI